MIRFLIAESRPMSTERGPGAGSRPHRPVSVDRQADGTVAVLVARLRVCRSGIPAQWEDTAGRLPAEHNAIPTIQTRRTASTTTGIAFRVSVSRNVAWPVRRVGCAEAAGEAYLKADTLNPTMRQTSLMANQAGRYGSSGVAYNESVASIIHRRAVSRVVVQPSWS